MKFHIDQIALCPARPEAAMKLLMDMGITNWSLDHVIAHGQVRNFVTANEANLAFNYDGIVHNELELLNYTKGKNWMEDPARHNSVSHIGMHCTETELELWRTFFAERDIRPIQEVFTDSHTNPAIAGRRRYHYAIFDTKAILGVDVKFIVRIEIEQERQTA